MYFPLLTVINVLFKATSYKITDQLLVRKWKLNLCSTVLVYRILFKHSDVPDRLNMKLGIGNFYHKELRLADGIELKFGKKSLVGCYFFVESLLFVIEIEMHYFCYALKCLSSISTYILSLEFFSLDKWTKAIVIRVHEPLYSSFWLCYVKLKVSSWSSWCMQSIFVLNGHTMTAGSCKGCRVKLCSFNCPDFL